MITAYTDYPFFDLGDKKGELAPIREVTVVWYDNDKYCDIIVEGTAQNIKAGYLYTQSGRNGTVPTIDPRNLV